MRKYHKTLQHVTLAAVIVSMIAILMSCEKIDDAEFSSDNSNSSYQKVSVTTRAATDADDILYPIRVSAIDKDGQVCTTQTLEDANSELSFKLPSGQYRITAVSGSTEFSSGYQNTPLLIGHTDISVEEDNVSCTIVLAYAVASIDMTLSHIPDEVTAVSLTLSPLYTGITENGEYSGTGNVCIPLDKVSAGTWTTAVIYVLPGATTTTTMTIAMSTPSGQETYSVTYNAALSAAVPYRFNGAFSGSLDSGYDVSGTFTNSGWQDEVRGDFTFGPSGGNNFSGTSSVAEFEVPSMPAAGSIWNGHIVALNTDGNALLISREEWSNMTSANHTTTPDAAAAVATAYSEDGLGEWAIPTSDEARNIKEIWSGANLDNINNVISNAGYVKLSDIDDKGKNVRYLCESARYTFTLSSTSGITAAGKTVDTYRLRLVKRIRFILK